MNWQINKTHLIVSIIISAVIVIVAANFTVLNGPNLATSNQGNIAGAVTREQSVSDFSLQNLDGELIKLSSYQGDKPVVLDFFATWSENCQRNVPNLDNFYQKYHDQVEIIGVNISEEQSVVEEFVNENDISFPIVLDADGSVAKQFDVQYTNYHVLINSDGTLFATIPGDITRSHIEQLIDANK